MIRQHSSWRKKETNFFSLFSLLLQKTFIVWLHCSATSTTCLCMYIYAKVAINSQLVNCYCPLAEMILLLLLLLTTLKKSELTLALCQIRQPPGLKLTFLAESSTLTPPLVSFIPHGGLLICILHPQNPHTHICD